MNIQNSTFFPGGVAFDGKIFWNLPYILVIVLSSVLLLLLFILFIREICKSQNSAGQCHCARPRCSSFDDVGVSFAEMCNCCQRTSFDSCLDSCCPKRGSLDAVDLLTCTICCSSSSSSTTTTTDATCFDCLLGLGENDSSYPRTQ